YHRLDDSFSYLRLLTRPDRISGTDSDRISGTGNDVSCLGLHDFICELDCDDDFLCTKDSFDVLNFVCKHEPIVDPALGCLDCNDNNICTLDYLIEPGDCVNDAAMANNLTCDDNNLCTFDDHCLDGSCVPKAVIGPAQCADPVGCTIDACDPAIGCANTPNHAFCDDGNVCTSELCDPNAGCVYPLNTNVCDDGNACTTADQCSSGSCLGGSATNCNDGNACTADSCVPGSGCTHAPVDCNDNNVCTMDDCDPIAGCIHSPNMCDDGNACTTDGCPPESQCTHAEVDCNDNNACTLDNCDPATGCTHTTLDCNDNNMCTLDSCSPTTGCAHVAKSGDCDDGNSCTTADVCIGIACVGTPVGCNLEGDCTQYFCGSTGNCEAASPITQWIDMSAPSGIFGGAGTQFSHCGPDGWTGGVHTQNSGALEYEVTLPAGVYHLWIRYAAETPRPVDIFLDATIVADNALSTPTGSWCGTSAAWALVGALPVSATGAPHILRVQHDPTQSCCFPHMDDILITNVLTFVPPQSPTQTYFGPLDSPLQPQCSLSVTAVSPTATETNAIRHFTVTGTDFGPTSAVEIPGLMIQNVTVSNSTSLVVTAAVPSEPATYDLTVSNADTGQSATFVGAIVSASSGYCVDLSCGSCLADLDCLNGDPCSQDVCITNECHQVPEPTCCAPDGCDACATGGDLNLSGTLTVADVQCGILTALWSVAGVDVPAPTCLLVPMAAADMDCGGSVDVVDVVLLVGATLGAPLSPDIDTDADNCHDNCVDPNP
ncbi:MAG: hypothetical protein HUU55_17975, partial [Myxococcales bacterium]|nr:hypothetical protein [Myxococcales bacterium]